LCPDLTLIARDCSEPADGEFLSLPRRRCCQAGHIAPGCTRDHFLEAYAMNARRRRGSDAPDEQQHSRGFCKANSWADLPALIPLFAVAFQQPVARAIGRTTSAVGTKIHSWRSTVGAGQLRTRIQGRCSRRLGIEIVSSAAAASRGLIAARPTARSLFFCLLIPTTGGITMKTKVPAWEQAC